MHKYGRWLLMAMVGVLAAQPIRVGTQASTPPILLITNGAASNKFGPYLAEILRAEGLNQFATKDVSVSPLADTDLTNVQLILLSEMPLTSAQANVLSNYVIGGGRLVAMRPDAQLGPVLGVTATGASTDEGYFAINAAVAFGDGFPVATLPFHGPADNYTAVSDATVLATLYSDAVTATAFPAVIKSRRTATWAYDLARSVVYTRQGNPANASERDGQPAYRTEDLFYNAIDRDKMNIPYADVQMRMLGRVITDLLADVMPLPRLWYFPNAQKTLMVVTGDSHTSDMSAYQSLISAVESHGGRLSLYISRFVSLQPSDLTAWRTAGHEIGMHPFGFADGVTLGQAYQVAQDWFANNNWGAPSRTVRNHQFEWQGWVDAAAIEAANGVALDTSFYPWGPAVTYADGHQAHGYINGSGLPMRFVDQAGVVVPVYQQVTSVVDEQLVVGSFSEQLSTEQALAVTRNLIDASQAGGYSAITTQFHVDYFNFAEVQPWAVGTMAYAQSLGIPMWTAERWLNYNTARAGSTFTGLSWDAAGKQLAFTVTVPANSEAQSVALPGAYNNFAVTSVTVDAAPASVATQPINGRDTSFLNIGPGTHSLVVTYATAIPPPEHAPIAHDDSANVTEAHTVVIPVLANDSDADGDVLTVTSTSSDPGAVITINGDQTISYAPNPGTCGIDTFSYDIDDGRGGTASANVTVAITCLNSQIVHQTFADFALSCAVPQGTIATRVGDGEVRLAGTHGDEYNQPSLDSSKWVAGTWAGGSYNPTLSAGLLSISNADGAYVRSLSAAPATTLEASARFSGLPFEHIGWAELNFAGAYAVFSTFNTTTSLFARTSLDGSSEQQTNLGPLPTGFHSFRIDRQVLSPTSNLVIYYIDGVVRAQHTVGSLPAMYVYQSHSGGTAQTLDVDRIWVYPPYIGAGSYQSCTMDIGHTLSSWTTVEWSAATPSATTLQLRTRTSTDGTTWSPWSAPLIASGQDITSPAGRYLQYLADFTTTDANQSPVLDSVTMRFADSTIPQEHAPVAVGDTASTSEGAAVTVAVLSNDSDPDNDPITVVSATQGSKGQVAINGGQTITYTPNVGACGTDAFTYTISDGRGRTASATVSINIACLNAQVTHTTVADFGPACAVASDTIVSGAGDGDVRLAGVQGDEFANATLDPALWVAGTWNPGTYSPVPAGGILSVADANGAYVRSASSMALTTLESSVRFSGLPFEHVGWGSLDFNTGYAMFSTLNTTTTLFARTNNGSGEQQTSLGPIPSGFHTYRIERQTAAPGLDTVSYFIDGALVVQHTVGTLAPMYVYMSNNGGTASTLDVDRIWAYPTYRGAGSFQSCTMDGGSSPFTWTTATWNASVPSGTTLQLSTRTSPDGMTWSPWSLPNVSSGQDITNPAGRYLQYLLAFGTTDAAVSPIVDSVTMHLHLVTDTPTLSINDRTVAEGNAATTTAAFTVSLSAPTSQAVTVNYATGDGTATAGSDFVAAAGTVTIPPGATTAPLPVVVNGDTLFEPNETFSVTLSNPTNATIAKAQGTGTISNDDVVPALSINNVTVTEGNNGTSTATFTVSLSAASGQDVTVNYATADGTATAGSDYTATSGTVTITAGATTASVPVLVNGDTLSESNETFVVNLSSPTNATIVTAQGAGTISNDDAVPTLSINNVTVTEGNTGTTTATFTVSLSTASGQDVTVNYVTADGTATAGSDYTATSGTVTIAAGATTASVPVVVNGDTLSESNETFVVNLSGATNATIATAHGTGTISNDDGVPTVSINNVTVTEGNSGTSTATFTVSLSAASGQDVTVNYATADGTATAGSDYAATSGTLTIPAGATTASVTVVVNGDTLTEATETFSVNLSGATNATIATPQGIGTISNDDVLPTLTINDVSVAEKDNGKATATFTVSLSAASGQTVTVNYATANGTATAGSDYTAASGTVTFAAGATSQSISVSILNDSTLEPNETFFVNLSAPTNATIADSQGVGTILNNDRPALAINNVSVTEGNSGTVNAVFTVTLSQPTTQTVTVNYATANGTATAGSDYAATSGTLTFAPGTTSAPVTVVVNGDTASEANETLFVNLSSANNATIATAQGIGTILNDENALPTLSINDVTVTEGDAGTAAATFTVNLSAAGTQTVTVNYATANGTATAGSDYAAASGPLTFAAGVTSQSITILINGDTTPEPNETFVVNLSSPSNATIADSQGLATILNDDAALPTLSINDVTVTEGDAGTATATFTVSLSAPSGQPVTVNYATANGTATAGTDYTAASGPLTFAAGVTSQSISILVNGDTTLEANETFVVNLSSPSNATLADGQGLGTILNDDPPALAINSVSVTEGNGGTVNAVFAVTLSQPTTQTVTVNYATADGTATAGSDYVATAGTATLAPGATSTTVVVVVNGDTTIEANETLTVNLSSATNAAITTAQGTGTIVNDDAAPTPTITVISPNGGENWGIGTTATVTWSSTNLAASESVVIELSTDAGGSYSVVLASSTPNDGSASFAVQQAWKGPRARIRVRSLTNSSVSDASNSNFKIQ